MLESNKAEDDRCEREQPEEDGRKRMVKRVSCLKMEEITDQVICKHSGNFLPKPYTVKDFCAH